MIAFLQGPTVQPNLMRMMLKRLSLMSTPRRGALRKKADRCAGLRNVWPWIAAGRVKPVIDPTFTLNEAERVNGGAHAGKIVLTN
jgi:NADPH:quinone reductase-like Zn-dependent oxidoreductase